MKYVLRFCTLLAISKIQIHYAILIFNFWIKRLKNNAYLYRRDQVKCLPESQFKNTAGLV